MPYGTGCRCSSRGSRRTTDSPNCGPTAAPAPGRQRSNRSGHAPWTTPGTATASPRSATSYAPGRPGFPPGWPWTRSSPAAATTPTASTSTRSTRPARDLRAVLVYAPVPSGGRHRARAARPCPRDSARRPGHTRRDPWSSTPVTPKARTSAPRLCAACGVSRCGGEYGGRGGDEGRDDGAHSRPRAASCARRSWLSFPALRRALSRNAPASPTPRRRSRCACAPAADGPRGRGTGAPLMSTPTHAGAPARTHLPVGYEMSCIRCWPTGKGGPAALAAGPPWCHPELYCALGRAPSCSMSEKRLATPQCSLILPSTTRIASTVSNWIVRPVGAMPKNSPSWVPW